MEQLIRVLQVLICLDPKKGSTHYTRVITLQLLVLLYQERNKTPAWAMLINNFSVFNEETGELAFSVLARCVLGDSLKSKFDHLNNMYTLLHTYISLAEDVKNDMSLDVTAQAWRKKIMADSTEVLAVRAWFESFARRIRHNSWFVYEGETGYKNASTATRHQTTRGTAPPMFSENRITAGVEHVLAKCRKMLVDNRFGYQVSHVWPEFKDQVPVPAPGALHPIDDEGVTSDDSDAEYLPTDAQEEKQSRKRKDAPDAKSDSDNDTDDEKHETPAEDVAPGPSMDTDARGQAVGWGTAANVNPGNILPDPRSARRAGAVRDFGVMVPYE
jgi:hypothetical protein